MLPCMHASLIWLYQTVQPLFFALPANSMCLILPVSYVQRVQHRSHMGEASKGVKASGRGVGLPPSPSLVLTSVCAVRRCVLCVQLHEGMHTTSPADSWQSQGQAPSCYNILYNRAKGWGAPMLVCFAHPCAQSYAATGTSAYSDLHILAVLYILGANGSS
jgi:hypothetical protein